MILIRILWSYDINLDTISKSIFYSQKYKKKNTIYETFVVTIIYLPEQHTHLLLLVS